jgi:hypothetical protein
LDDWIYGTLYIHTTRDYRQNSAIAVLRTFQFTVTHSLGFSVFTRRILATDLWQSHCNFKAHMKSSLHRLIPLLPFLLIYLTMPCPELDNLTTILSNDLLCPFISLRQGPHRKHSLSIVEVCLLIRCLITDVLLLRAYASAGMCIPNRCLAMNLYVTMYLWFYFKQNSVFRSK